MAAANDMVPVIDGYWGQEGVADDIVGALEESPGCILVTTTGVPLVDLLKKLLLQLAPHFPSPAIVIPSSPFKRVCEQRLSSPLPPVFIIGELWLNDEVEKPSGEDTDLAVIAFTSRPSARKYTKDLGVPWVWIASPCGEIVSWEISQGAMVKSALKT
jgi:hypothetical protein